MNQFTDSDFMRRRREPFQSAPLRGHDGDAGAIGPTGATGVTGGAGAAGATGPAGAAGANGATGADGNTGPTGAAGATGADGAVGGTGPTGMDGPAGATGATGATGADGIQGPKGLPGGDSIITNEHGTRAVGLVEGTEGQWIEVVPAGQELEPWLNECLATRFRFRSVCGTMDLVVGTPKHCLGWRMPEKTHEHGEKVMAMWKHLREGTLLEAARNS